MFGVKVKSRGHRFNRKQVEKMAREADCTLRAGSRRGQWYVTDDLLDKTSRHTSLPGCVSRIRAIVASRSA